MRTRHCKQLDLLKKDSCIVPPGKGTSTSLPGCFTLTSTRTHSSIHHVLNCFNHRHPPTHSTLGCPMLGNGYPRWQGQAPFTRYIPTVKFATVNCTGHSRSRCEGSMAMHLTSAESSGIMRVVGICDCSMPVTTAGLPITIIGDASSVATFALAMWKARSVFALVVEGFIIIRRRSRRFERRGPK